VDEQAIKLIVDRALAGDGAAFAALFREYKRDVYCVCRRMLGHAESAEDAVSESFLRARRALDGFDPEQPFRPWLISIAGHHCIDQLRRKSLESRIFSESPMEESQLKSIAPSALVRILAMEERQSLGRAIEVLPARYRLPLLLRYFEDMDYEAIAKSIGVTKKQVGTLLFRAKALLRAEVESMANQHSNGLRVGRRKK